MEQVLELIITSFVKVYTIMRGCEFHIWIFDISLFDIFMSLLVLEFILSVIFPHVLPEDED